MRLILDTISEAHDQSGGSPRADSPTISVESSSSQEMSPELLKLKMKLLPLQQIEGVLIRKLNPIGSHETEGTHLASHQSGKTKFNEISVHSTTQWKVAFGKILTSRSSTDSGADIDWANPNDPGVVLNACAEDIVKLWNNPIVKELLSQQKIRLEDMSGL